MFLNPETQGGLQQMQQGLPYLVQDHAPGYGMHKHAGPDWEHADRLGTCTFI